MSASITDGSTLYHRAFALFRKGVCAPKDDKLYRGAIQYTPKRIKDGEGHYDLTDIQLHSVSRILRIFQEGNGAILALDIGLGKTLVVLGKFPIDVNGPH